MVASFVSAGAGFYVVGGVLDLMPYSCIRLVARLLLLQWKIELCQL